MGIIHNEIAKIIPKINEIMLGIIESVYEKGKAEYIRGEDEAFKVLAECTNKAKVAVRSTRFSPWSVMKQTGYAMETPLTFYLTEVDNNFEIVVINNSDAFLYFYDARRVIVATLHVQGGELVKEFQKIFDRLINGNREKIVKIECINITYDNISKLIEGDE